MLLVLRGRGGLVSDIMIDARLPIVLSDFLSFVSPRSIRSAVFYLRVYTRSHSFETVTSRSLTAILLLYPSRFSNYLRCFHHDRPRIAGRDGGCSVFCSLRFRG